MEKTINWEMYQEIQKTAYELAKRKNADYGTDSLKNFGELGCLIRMHDKVNRLRTLLTTSKAQVLDESIEDTCLDIINYSVYLILLKKKMLEQ